MRARNRIEPKQIRRVMNIVDDDVDVTVVVEIRECGAASGGGGGDRRSQPTRHVLEASLAKIAVDDLRLLVAGFPLNALNFGIDVTVDEEQIEPPVVIEVQEAHAPAQPSCVDADPSGECAILARPFSI